MENEVDHQVQVLLPLVPLNVQLQNLILQNQNLLQLDELIKLAKELGVQLLLGADLTLVVQDDHVDEIQEGRGALELLHAALHNAHVLFAQVLNKAQLQILLAQVESEFLQQEYLEQLLHYNLLLLKQILI